MADKTLAFSRTQDTKTVWLALYGEEGNKQPPLESFRLSQEHQWCITSMLIRSLMQNIDNLKEEFCTLDRVKLTPSRLEFKIKFNQGTNLFEITGRYFEKEDVLTSFSSTYIRDEIWMLVKFMIPEPVPSKIVKINDC